MCVCSVVSEMCSERDSPLEPFVLLAPGQPELARLICGAHLGPPVLTRKQKRPRVNSLVCDRVAAFSVAGPPEVLSRMSRPVTQAAERERELARACSQRLKQAAPSLPGESVSRGFADRGALEGYPSHYTSLVVCTAPGCMFLPGGVHFCSVVCNLHARSRLGCVLWLARLVLVIDGRTMFHDVYHVVITFINVIKIRPTTSCKTVISPLC